MVFKKALINVITYVMIGVLFSIGTLKICSYAFNITNLPGSNAQGVINPITAICFMSIGVWLFIYMLTAQLAKRLQPIVTVIVLAASILKSAELLGISPLQIDRYIFPESLNAAEGFVSIAPNSALLLLLCGVILFNVYKQGHISRLLSDICKITGFLISYLAIIGYIYNFEQVYRVGNYVPMALNTAIGYICYFTVALLAMPPGKFKQLVWSAYAGGRMSRRAIPLVLVLPMALGYLRLMGEELLLFDPSYGTALESSAIVFFILTFVFLYARRLNIQDRKRIAAEQQITESERKYRTLVNALREGVVYYDTKGIISFCNRSFSELSGFTDEEVRGRSVFDFFVKEEQKEKYRNLLENPDNTQKSEIYEENVRRKNGEYIWVSISARPVFNDEGEMIAALSTIVDISERKKQLEDIEAFSASAAHDINAPLARIEMIAMLLIESTEGQLDEESLELLQAIAGITSNMRGLLRDLLQFSKLGASAIEKSSVDTEAIVKEITAANMHLNPKAEVKVNSLPTLLADKGMLKQVFANLIGNALKYSANKEKPVVEIGCEQKDGSTVIYVKDNGAGFDMKDSQKLFAAFQRLHVEFEGTGLGLPIVRRIVEKHGGKIWAHGVPQEGAAFYFTLD